jgi:hypothetical protein
VLLAKRDQEVVPFFDELAAGLARREISRGKAIKLCGATLVASALGLFASQADAQVVVEGIGEVGRRRCRRHDGDFCRGQGCKICCRDRSKTACCGTEDCNCCRRNERCGRDGRCG